VEVGRVAGQHGDATEWISLYCIAVELIARADVEDTRHDCVDLILLVSVWHQLHAGGRHNDAKAILAPIYDQFTEGFETADLRAARDILNALQS